MDARFYDDSFDPVLPVVTGLPGDYEAQLEHLLSMLSEADVARDTVTARLSKHVIKHHKELIKGMRNVEAVDCDVARATIHVTNARRKVSQARAGIVDGHLALVGHRRRCVRGGAA